MHYWGNSVRTLPDARRRPILQHALATLDVSLHKAEAPDKWRYAQLSRSEGAHYSQMWVHTILSGQPAASQQQQEAFGTWTVKAGRAMALLDSSIDLKKDYREGNLAFEPTMVGRLALFGWGSVDIPAILLPAASRWGRHKVAQMTA